MFQRFHLTVTRRPSRPVGIWWIFSSVKKEKWWRSLFGVKDSILPAEGRLLSGDKSKWVSQLKMNNNICTMYIGHSCQRSPLFPVGFWPDFYNFDQNFDHIWHYWQYVSQFAFNFTTFPDFSEMRVEIWQRGRQTGQERLEWVLSLTDIWQILLNSNFLSCFVVVKNPNGFILRQQCSLLAAKKFVASLDRSALKYKLRPARNTKYETNIFREQLWTLRDGWP